MGLLSAPRRLAQLPPKTEKHLGSQQSVAACRNSDECIQFPGQTIKRKTPVSLSEASMDYLPYLLPANMEIFQLAAQKAKMLEDSEVCQKHDIFGFYFNPKRELSICTTRILGHPDPVASINATFLHEVVHLAQACKAGFKYVQAFGMKASTMPLAAAEATGLKKSIAFDRRAVHLEREAFFLESRPLSVRYVLKKYCF
jgi:hypothetical protein